MAVLYLVIPIALVLAGAGLGAFLWAVRRGQFDDLDTPAVRMLFDDEPSDPGPNTSDEDQPKADPSAD